MKAALLSLVLLASGFQAAQAQSLDQLNQLEKMEEAIDTIDQFQVKLDAMLRERRTDCSQAFGNETFCECLLDKLPVAWSFADYVAITTRSKEENGYAQLNAEYKDAYDKVAPVRDQCVVSSRGKR